MGNEEKVLVKIEGRLAIITLNRPQRLNAFDSEVWAGLEEAAKSVRCAPDVRVVILTGAGERAFSAGLDLKMVSAGEELSPSRPTRDWFDRIQGLKDVFTMYDNLPVPVIAAINGYCLGAGLELVLACDIRIASETASFSLPEVSLGVIPDMGSTQRLPRVVGLSKAKELILTSRRIDAAEALRIGLVDHVYPQESLMTEARQLAEEIASHLPAVVEGAKRAINVALSTPLELGLSYETATAVGTLSAGGLALQETAADFTKKKSKQ